MATTETTTIPEPGGSPSFAQRVTQIPSELLSPPSPKPRDETDLADAVVADTLSTVHSTLSTNSYSKPIYGRAEGAAQYLYEQSKPLQEKLAGPIGQVDAIANKGLDFVQAKAPYVCPSPPSPRISKIGS